MNQYQTLNQSFINGKWTEGEEDNRASIMNPYDNNILATVRLASLNQLNTAFAGASKAQATWSKNTKQRQDVLYNAIQYFEDHKSSIIEMLILESGSTVGKAYQEYDFTIGVMEESLTMVDEIGKFNEKPSIAPDKINEFYRMPKGVIASVAPFNFPLFLSMRTIAPALALGNTVVHKPDLKCGIISGSVIAKAFEQAGLPSGVFQSILTQPEVIGDTMFNHKTASLVSFTGSTAVGRRAGQIAGGQLKNVALELGGNAPFCVLSDADVDKAVDAAIFGKYLHQGQICMTTNRIIIHEDIYDEFADKFLARSKNINYGDPRDPNVTIGPLIDENQMEKALTNIEKAKKAGFDMLLEGEQLGNVLTPTVIGNVDNNSDLAQTEMFSPIAMLLKAQTDEDIIAKANDTEFGLSAAIFSNDEDKARQFALELNFGMTHINDQTVNDEPTAFFGGMKQSGIGRFGSPFVIDEFTEGKWISVQKRAREFPF